MPDLTPTDHAAEAERLLAELPGTVTLPEPEAREELLRRAQVHALLASRPTTVEFEGKRRCEQCSFEHPETDMVLARDGRRWTCADCVGELLDEAEQKQAPDSEVVRRAVRAETSRLQDELADAKRETVRLHDVLARLIGERDALRERTYELVQCLEADPACMRLVGQIPSLYEAYNRARFVSRVGEATSPEPVPSTGEDQGTVLCQTCGSEGFVSCRSEPCEHGGHNCPDCNATGSRPVPDEGSRDDA